MSINSISSGNPAPLQSAQPLAKPSETKPGGPAVNNDHDGDDGAAAQAASQPSANMKGQAVGALINALA
ncbi:MAG: hypothetical protein HQK60_16225 [Deltaproteobacteria bacterium]|nr:hypothetical protein [Deltaproteobacteria bacterium]